MFVIMGCGRAETPPKMVIDGLEKSVGTVWKGEPAKFDFLVKNEGGQPLDLDIKPGCGCTVANANKMTIPPGKEDHVIATVSTEHFSGPVTKIVTVTSNDPDQKSVMLKLSAVIKPYVECQPQASQYFRIYKGDGKDFTYTLYSNDETPLEVKELSSSVPNLTAKFSKAEMMADGKPTYRIEVKLSPDTPPGSFNGVVSVATMHPKAQVVRIEIHGLIQQEITVSPTFVHFGSLKPGDKSEKLATVSKRKDEFNITNVATNNEHVTTEVETQVKGKEYVVHLKYDGALPKGDMRGKATITTDDPEQPQITIDFAAIIQ